jgi:hypothetical protein
MDPTLVAPGGEHAPIWAWLAIYGVSALLVAAPAFNFARALRSRRWPTTPGTVLRIASEEDEGIMINVLYEYRVGSRVLRGGRIRFGGGPYYRQKTVNVLMARYAKGTTVEVRYDPAKPSLCVLETKFEFWSWAPFVFLALAIAAPYTWHLLAS